MRKITKEKHTYGQYEKKKVRNVAIKRAIEVLTLRREESCCVKRDYVRKVYDFFYYKGEESQTVEEVKKISPSHIVNWENLHDSCVGYKRPSDLCVCYLCGPEPNNDFQELINAGILPQNIWAFESDSKTYRAALDTYDEGEFPQPKIIKQNIETFFKYTPKKFDLIYVDACGSVPSSQHALRCITTICLNQRLASPGVIISNFAKPDMADESIEGFYEIITQYLLFKKHPNIEVVLNSKGIENLEYKELYEAVKHDFDLYYGEFISAFLRDVPAIFVPLQRAISNPYFRQLFEWSQLNNYSIEEYMQYSKNYSVGRFILLEELLKSKNMLSSKCNLFIDNEIGNYSSILEAVKFCILLKSGKLELNDEIKSIKKYFEESRNIYQFLDKTHVNLFFDIVLNQVAYPMHSNLLENRCYQYTAKKNTMFLDVAVYDECRYIYDWLPALHQIVSAFENVSWQYVFRFALDGLIKMRQNYNNEFFYQGAVVSNLEEGFGSVVLKDREIVYS